MKGKNGEAFARVDAPGARSSPQKINSDSLFHLDKTYAHSRKMV